MDMLLSAQDRYDDRHMADSREVKSARRAFDHHDAAACNHEPTGAP